MNLIIIGERQRVQVVVKTGEVVSGMASHPVGSMRLDYKPLSSLYPLLYSRILYCISATKIAVGGLLEGNPTS